MKLLHLAIIVMLLFSTIIPTQAEGVLCNSSMTECTIGAYTVRGSSLQVKDGIICTSSGAFCTNGQSILRIGNNYNNNSNNSTTKKQQKIITQFSEADGILKLAELYKNGFINQTEYNKIMKSKQVVQTDKFIELNKLAKSYEQGFITQSDYNKKKNSILNF